MILHGRYPHLQVQQLCALFTSHGLPCEASGEIRKQIWCKLLYNLAVSPMSTLTDLSLRWTVV